MLIPLVPLPLRAPLRIRKRIRKPVAAVRKFATRITAVIRVLLAMRASTLTALTLAVGATGKVLIAPGIPPIGAAVGADYAAEAAVGDTVGVVGAWGWGSAGACSGRGSRGRKSHGAGRSIGG